MATASDPVTFVAVGDVHGEMDAMVAEIARWERRVDRRIAFVVQLGDFGPHRHARDLKSMHSPSGQATLGDFHHYHSGRARFPWPLHFIAGNHEPFGWLDRLQPGSQLVHNCHYFGRAGRQTLGGLQVVGLSGIHDEDRLTVPRPDVASILETARDQYCRFTEQDVDDALAFGRADILLLHDWPEGIADDVDPVTAHMRRAKMGLAQIGNEYSRMVLDALEPALVLCGHMHLRHRTSVTLGSGRQAKVCCLDKVARGAPAFAGFAWDGASIDELAWTPA